MINAVTIPTPEERAEKRQVIKYWLSAIALDGSAMVLIYLWLFANIGSVEKGVYWLMWVFAGLGILSALSVRQASLKALWRPVGFSTYHYVTDAIIIGTLAWHGYYGIATVMLVTSLYMEVQRNAIVNAYRSGVKSISTNLVTLAGKGSISSALQAILLYSQEQRKITDDFDMRYCSVFLAGSVLSDSQAEVVVLRNWDETKLLELRSMVSKFPHIQFYATLSKHS